MRLEPALIFSSGMFAGLGTTLSLVAGPAVLASSDPLPSWKLLYRNGGMIAIPSILTGSISGLAIYFMSNKPDPRYLIVAGMTFINIPYTILVMGKTIKTLEDMDSTAAKNDEVQVRKLIENFCKMHRVRTVLGVSAFAITIGLAVCNRH